MEAKDLEAINFQPPFKVRIDGKYRIENFDVLYDRAFVLALYSAILRRAPDAGGETHYLELLRGGEDKAKLLGIFLHSEEGRKYPTVINGLAARLRWLRIFEFPVVGRLIAALFFLMNINEHMRDLRVIENHIIRIAEETQRKNEYHLRRLQSLIR
jgi:hypothetical protein